VFWADTNISEEHSASVFRVEGIWFKMINEVIRMKMHLNYLSRLQRL
jgi:hypothetical protein